MRAKHDTSDRQYRAPFGATEAGGAVFLAIDVWDEPDATAQLRVWVDEKGERLLDMAREEHGDHLRFSVTFTPEEPEIIWYSFNICAGDGAVWRYGAPFEHACGEGAFAYGEPPSFQITVFEQQRTVLPTWYTDGVVYQIFPDRFARGEGWRKLVENALAEEHNGPVRRLVEDWDQYPCYEKNHEGRVTAWDFSGGTLEGVREKLDYLEALGITIIYLNPIFAAASNHRYDTADYMRIDPMLGTEEDFSRLCKDAEAHGISIILDGVFNHVGADSIYFNKYGNYPGIPATEGEHSPYHSWFEFRDDGSYAAWWGVDDLPAVREDCAEFRELICGRDGVVRKWLRLGARGWRLDVADELTDEFIADIKAAALAEREDAVVIGEVWEDASHKVAYGKLRRYFQGAELDATMNYPLRDSLLGFLTGGVSAPTFAATLESLCENYPHEAFAGALNLIGSHDRMRVLTALGNAPAADSMNEEQRRNYRLNEGEHELALSRLWIAALLQMTLPGVPSVYYGDEAGLEGYADPYNRSTFPWGHEDENCFKIYRNSIALRKTLPVLTHGDFRPFSDGDDVFGFWRTDDEGNRVCVLVNRSLTNGHTVRIPAGDLAVDDVVCGRPLEVKDGCVEVYLRNLGTAVLHLHKAVRLQAAMERGMGVLCHITSLPNLERPGNPGTLGEPARRFIDDLAAAGQKYWQVLPVNPTDGFGSPYAGLSAFAGNTSLMWGLGDDTAMVPSDFEGTTEYRRFLEKNERWLLPYATFLTIKGKMDNKAWQEWPAKYRTWSPKLARSKELAAGVKSECARQYAFVEQWEEMRRYANERGIKIIGDMPIYVSADSSDVWADRELFELDESGYPASQAGCPPDMFSADGQLWGNPTYNWGLMRSQGFEWWMRRLERAFELYDYVRLDHFLGFSSYYSILRGQTAKEGAWRFGPGPELFECAYKKFGPLPVIAEDLGSITPAVCALVSETGIPGMDVIQFADHDVRQGYVPTPGKMVYTSTHDTNTLLGWVEKSFFGCDTTAGQDIAPQELERAYATARELRGRCLASAADVVIVPLQDAMMLDDSARMNTPGVADGNWSWKADPEALQVARAVLTELAAKSGR